MTARRRCASQWKQPYGGTLCSTDKGDIADTAPACAANTSVFLAHAHPAGQRAWNHIGSRRRPTVDDARAQEMASGVSFNIEMERKQPLLVLPKRRQRRSAYVPSFDHLFIHLGKSPQGNEMLSRELNTLLNNRAVYPYGSKRFHQDPRGPSTPSSFPSIFTGCFAGHNHAHCHRERVQHHLDLICCAEESSRS